MQLPRRLKFVIDVLNRDCLCWMGDVLAVVAYHLVVESNVANNLLSKHDCSHHAACCQYYQDGVPDDGVEKKKNGHVIYMMPMDCRQLSHAIFDRR